MPGGQRIHENRPHASADWREVLVESERKKDQILRVSKRNVVPVEPGRKRIGMEKGWGSSGQVGRPVLLQKRRLKQVSFKYLQG